MKENNFDQIIYNNYKSVIKIEHILLKFTCEIPVDEKNEIFFKGCGNLSPANYVLKTSRGSPRGKVKIRQYLLTVGLSYYT